MAVVFASALMAVSTMFAGEDVTEYYAVIISILFVALYGIMTVLLKLAARKNRELLMVITCGIAIVELAVNMAVTGLGCTGRSSYNANVDDMQKALELAKEDAADNNVPFYRVEDTGRLTKNDGTRYGYASGTRFFPDEYKCEPFLSGALYGGGKISTVITVPHLSRQLCFRSDIWLQNQYSHRMS